LALKKIESLVNSRKLHTGIHLKRGYWLAFDFPYTDHQHEIESAARSLNDEKSRRLLKEIWNYRQQGDIRTCPQPSRDDEYIPKDLQKYKGPLKMIDCGACTGQALEQIVNAGYELHSFVAFEPDAKNFELLRKKNYASQKATYLPLGVWSTEAQLKFKGSGSTGSALDEEGDTVIQCVSLDHIIQGFHPNLIKLDVEGAEIEAMRGMEQIIREDRPNLCISIYHEPSHLYELPLLVQSWNLGYQLAIRVHEYNTFGVVLYCLNPNRIQVRPTN
jgi:FkbM family methyltransferase